MAAKRLEIKGYLVCYQAVEIGAIFGVQIMEIAELIIFAAMCYALYKVFTPLQRHLEKFLLRWFRRGSKSGQRPVIDITDYTNPKTKKGPKP
ncbi:MAG: hypothetical protein ACXWP5_13355 [Bdellovibrionota bacterium]